MTWVRRYSIVKCMWPPGQPFENKNEIGERGRIEHGRRTNKSTWLKRSINHEHTLQPCNLYLEDDLVGLVELLETNPVLGVDGLLLHWQKLSSANLVVAEPLTRLGNDRDVLFEPYEK